MPSSRLDMAERLMRYLDSSDVAYVVVGDYRFYLDSLQGDLDFIVAPDSLRTLRKSLFSFFRNHHFPIVQMLQHEQTAWYLACVHRDATGTLHFFHPDICGNYFRSGSLLLAADPILKNRIQVATQSDHFRNMWIPSPRHAFIYYLLKKIDKGRLEGRHERYLYLEWQKDPTGCADQLTRFWGQSDTKLIRDAVSRNDWAKLQGQLPRLSSEIRRRVPFSLGHTMFEWIRIGRRILRPTGIHVAFLGPDGVGKSTVIEKIARHLAPAFRRKNVYHLRPFFGHRQASVRCNPHPQRAVPRGLFSSLTKLALWWLDFTVGYFMTAFLDKIQSTLVLSDRYYHDILVDPKRYRYGGPLWLARWVGKLVPQPDLTIILDAEPVVVQSRKQEVPLEETCRQRVAYRKLLAELRHTSIIDASKPLSEVVQKVEAVILDYMGKRALNRNI